MKSYVADTHALFWYLSASPRLSPQAKIAFDEGARGEAIIYISVISLAELYYLNDKLVRPLDFAVEMRRLRSSAQFEFVPLTPDDILEFQADMAVPEMHDRIITGVARRYQAVCLTRDPQIVASGLVVTLW
jgi:PIN domain nuclease of toxin-antitoxin system